MYLWDDLVFKYYKFVEKIQNLIKSIFKSFISALIEIFFKIFCFILLKKDTFTVL